MNSAKDDAAGLAIATRMEAQSRGMNVAMRNANDGISALTVADGALSVATEMFQRIRELWVQGMNGTYSDSDKHNIQTEMQLTMNSIDELFRKTDFNGSKLLGYNGAHTASSPIDIWKVKIQIGSNVGDTLEIKVFPDPTFDEFGDPIDYPNLINSLDFVGLGSTPIGLQGSHLWNMDQSMDAILKARANIGAQLSRLDGIVSNLQVANENVQAARGRIVDADYAAETASLTRAQILQQAGTAMLAQANAQPQQVLKLLQQ